MTYATRQDMIESFSEEELIQLTDRSGFGQIDDGTLNKALADADAEIDAYLAIRYDLPLATVPPVLTRFAAAIARYQLYDSDVPDKVKDQYDNAIKFCKSLSNGSASLGFPKESAPASTGGPAHVSGEKVFSKAALGGY